MRVKMRTPPILNSFIVVCHGLTLATDAKLHAQTVILVSAVQKKVVLPSLAANKRNHSSVVKALNTPALLAAHHALDSVYSSVPKVKAAFNTPHVKGSTRLRQTLKVTKRMGQERSPSAEQVSKMLSFHVPPDMPLHATVAVMNSAQEVWSASIPQHATPEIASTVERAGRMPLKFVARLVVEARLTNVVKESFASPIPDVNQVYSSVENHMMLHQCHVLQGLQHLARARAQVNAQTVNIALPLSLHVQIMLTTSSWGHLGISEDLLDQILLNSKSPVGWLGIGKQNQSILLQRGE